jgi:hypothetical protein
LVIRPADRVASAGRWLVAARGGASARCGWAAVRRRPTRGAAGIRSGRWCCAARRRPIRPGRRERLGRGAAARFCVRSPRHPVLTTGWVATNLASSSPMPGADHAWLSVTGRGAAAGLAVLDPVCSSRPPPVDLPDTTCYIIVISLLVSNGRWRGGKRAARPDGWHADREAVMGGPGSAAFTPATAAAVMSLSASETEG